MLPFCFPWTRITTHQVDDKKIFFFSKIILIYCVCKWAMHLLIKRKQIYQSSLFFPHLTLVLIRKRLYTILYHAWKELLWFDLDYIKIKIHTQIRYLYWNSVVKKNERRVFNTHCLWSMHSFARCSYSSAWIVSRVVLSWRVSWSPLSWFNCISSTI